ncbi:MAG: hypothetical protein HYX48_05835 [Chlamydiales bacterium]|nr:hypothetical protein [Chlamydiales bacterium]
MSYDSSPIAPRSRDTGGARVPLFEPLPPSAQSAQGAGAGAGAGSAAGSAADRTAVAAASPLARLRSQSSGSDSSPGTPHGTKRKREGTGVETSPDERSAHRLKLEDGSYASDYTDKGKDEIFEPSKSKEVDPRAFAGFRGMAPVRRTIMLSPAGSLAGSPAGSPQRLQTSPQSSSAGAAGAGAGVGAGSLVFNQDWMNSTDADEQDPSSPVRGKQKTIVPEGFQAPHNSPVGPSAPQRGNPSYKVPQTPEQVRKMVSSLDDFDIDDDADERMPPPVSRVTGGSAVKIRRTLLEDPMPMDVSAGSGSGAAAASSPAGAASAPRKYWDSALEFKETKFFGSPDSSPTASSASAKPAAAMQTPPKVKDLMAILGGADFQKPFTPKTHKKVKDGMGELAALQKQGTVRDLIERTQQVVYKNFGGGAAAGSVEYHRQGVKALPAAHKMVKNEVLRALKGLRTAGQGAGAGAGAGSGSGAGSAAGAEIPHFFNVDHIISAQKKGKATLGLHFITDAEFREKYVATSQVVSAMSGAIARDFIIKGDSAPAKFSTFFPEGMFGTFGELMEAVYDGEVVALEQNRMLLSLDAPEGHLLSEIYLRGKDETGTGQDIFPVFAYINYLDNQSYTIANGVTVNSDMLFKMACDSLMRVSLVMSKECPLKYLTRNKDGTADLIFDIAPLLKTVKSGILLQISSEQFSGDKKLKAQMKNILEFWGTEDD